VFECYGMLYGGVFVVCVCGLLWSVVAYCWVFDIVVEVGNMIECYEVLWF